MLFDRAGFMHLGGVLVVCFSLFSGTLSQDLQLNVHSNNDLHQGAVRAAREYISTAAIEVIPIALFIHNQSYNSIYRVILGKQISMTTIQVIEIKIYTGKNTSGRFDIFYYEVLNNFSPLNFIHSSYVVIQQAVEEYLKEQGKTLRYIRLIEKNNEGIVIVHPVIKEEGEFVLMGSQWKTENAETKGTDQLITGMFRIFTQS